MTVPHPPGESAPRRPPRRLPVRLRLPLVIGGLLAIVVAAYSWAAYDGVRRASTRVAQERLAAAASQILGLLDANVTALDSTAQALAGNRDIRAFALAPSAARRAAAERALRPGAADRAEVTAAALVSADGRPLAAFGDTARWADHSAGSGGTGGVGALRRAGDSLEYSVAAPVSAGGRVAGYVVQWRRMASSARSRDALNQLIGAGARLYLGDSAGGVWSDFAGPVAAPVEHLAPSGRVVGSRGASGDFLAIARPVARTPWVLLVTIPEATVLAPARAWLRGGLLVGIVVLAIGLLAAWALSRSLTGPLIRMTREAEALAAEAAGGAPPAAPGAGGDELDRLATAFATMAVKVREAQRELEARVAQRTAELAERNRALVAANAELDAFAYSVSHDLRAPLRSIDGFSQVLLEDSAARLDAAARDALQRVRAASQRMGLLIDDLLALSRLTRADMRVASVDLSALAREVTAELERSAPERRVAVTIAPELSARGDPRLLRVALENLLGNAWKYTGRTPEARIEFGATARDGAPAFFVRDNGAGFDMQYAAKLFGAFQRLHPAGEFDGTGVGLAIVHRVITRHGGRVWAEGAVGRGATFYFTLEPPLGGREVT